METLLDLYNFGLQILELFKGLLSDLVDLLQYEVLGKTVIEYMFGVGLITYIVAKIII